jgi:TctA family transporter
MESSLFEAAAQGISNLLHAHVIMAMIVGIGVGTVTAVTPQGLGMPLVYALAFPVVIRWDPITAIAFLIGASAVSSICAAYLPILFGLPGGAGSQATVLDGYPMGRAGEARRALGASFMAGGVGAVIGTLTLAAAIPVARPIIYLMGSPELFVVVFWGLTMVAVLAGKAPVKGLIAGAFGLLLSTVGQQEQSGVMRYTFGQIYLLDGFSISMIVLGLFGIPAALDLALTRMGIEQAPAPLRGSLLEGVKDTLRHFWLVVRCSFFGVWVGIIPGLGSQVVDWLSYGYAAQSCKGAADTFGKGDVRGVIAPESSNDAKDGGDLITLLLLGIPQSAVTALFLALLLTWGLVPGPELVQQHADVIYTIIFVQGFAGVIGTMIGFILARQLAKLAEVRYSILVPIIMAAVFLGAFSTNRDSADLLAVVLFGGLGYLMKRFGVPRPPLVLGLVLGHLLERYLYRSMMTYGFSWLTFPSVVVLLVLVATSLGFSLLHQMKGRVTPQQSPGEGRKLRVRVQPASLIVLLFLAAFLVATVLGWNWRYIAKLMPVYFVAIPGLILCLAQLCRDLVGWEQRKAADQGNFEMDEKFRGGLDTRTEVRRTFTFFDWLAAGAIGIWLLGITIALPILVLTYALVDGREKWWVSLSLAGGIFLFLWGLFQHIFNIWWPPGVLFD